MSGAPTVCLHGFAGHAESWEPLHAALPDEALAALTLFGHDPTRPVTDMIAFEDEVARIAGALRAQGGPVRLVGYSMGGRISLGLLRMFPELVASVVLVGANPGLHTEKEREERIKGDEVWARLLEDEGMEAFAAKWEAQGLFATQAKLPAPVLAHQRAIRQRHDARSLAWSMRSLSLGRMPSYWETLERAELPVDIVVGALDAKFSALAVEMKKRTKPGLARILSVADVGHNVLLERPDLLARIVVSPRTAPLAAGIAEV